MQCLVGGRSKKTKRRMRPMPRRGDVHRRPYSRPQSLDPGTALPAMPIRYNIVAVKLYTYVYVPGYTHFATSIDMALTLGPSLDVRVETSEQLSSQLAKSQRESKELKEKLLRAEAKAYLLAKHLRDHNCEEYEDLIESMLREKPHFLEGQLAEELLPVENLKKCGVQIQEQAQELTQLQQKLQEGRALSQLIHQNLQALLTQQDPDSCQSRQLLTELLKLTEHLVAKLSTVNQTSGNQEEPYVDSPHTSRPSLRLAQLELLNGLPKPRVGPWWPCPMDNIVEMAYDEICASVWNLQQEECFFREAGLGIGPTALDRERPSLGPALPSGPELELPRLGQFPVPCAAIAGPRWPCPAAGHVAVANLQVCDSARGLRREECHIFQTIDMFIGPTALDRERPSLGPALPSGPELELPRLGQFPVPCAAIAGPRWPCPAAGHVAVANLQVCDSARGLRREECHIFQTIDMFIGPTALDRERPSLGPALPSGPELELPRLGQFPVPCAAIAGPRWPCPAAGHVAVANLQVCDSARGLRREECHIFQTIDMFIGPTALDRERPSLGPALPSGPELELPRLGQFPVPCAAIAGPRWPCPAAGHVAVANLQVCDSARGLRREECHIFQTIDMFIGPTALDRERPSLGPALPSGPELELPRLGQFPVPCAAIAGPRWPCPAAGHVAVANLQVCDSARGLRREECHIFQTIDMFIGPTALDRERPSLGPALPSGPELELPRLGQFPVPCAAIAGPRWPCPAAGHVAVAYLQVCDSAWGLRREECHIFQTIDMFVGPTALDRERPSLGPALPSGPELELPRLGQFPVPRAAIAGPRWPCPAAGHVAVAYLQVCDSAWGLRREECHIFQTIDMFVGPTALDRERPSLGPALPSGPELELPRLGQFPVPRAAIAGPRWPCPAAGHVAVAYFQVCDSAWGLRREECHIFQTIDMFVGPTALDRERPSLGPALPSGPELELPRLGQFPVPRAAIAGPRWPCPAAGHVAVAYFQVCDSAWGLRREECHIFQTIDMFVGPTALDRERPSLGPALPSGPELELPRLGQFPVPRAAIAGPRWPCPAAGHVAVAYFQVCDSAWGLRREECHIFQTIDMFVGPTALDRERPSLGPALPSGPELELPRLGQFPVPRAAIAGPRWPCPAAGHVAVAYFQVCDSAWGLRREECHIFQTIDMFVGPTALDRERPSLGPALPSGPELELPRLGQFPVPRAAIAGPRWPCPAAGHVAVAYFQVCDSAWGLRREECHIFQTIDMFVGPTALDRERPSLGPALPSGPELELPRLGQFPVPRAAIAGPRWPCPAAGHVAVAYFQVCDSAWGLRREECHIFQTIDMFVGPTALDRERPSLGPALPSGPELELPRLGQFPVPRAAIAGPRWPCPAAGHVAVAYLQVCDSAWGLRREECHIFQTIDMFVGPTALDRERPSLGPALPSGPELELPRLGQFPVPRAAIAGPRWPCPAAGHVAVAYLQVCDSAWGLRREECHIFQTIDMFVGPTALDRERPSLGPALPSGPELELPRLGQFPVPRAAIAGPRWPCPAAGHVAVAYLQVCDSAWGLRREECHIFQTIDMFVGPTALDRERPSLGPALPSGPELELPRLGQFPVPCAAIAGPRWPCPAAGHVAVAYLQVCDSAWGLRREECHIFQTIDMFVGPTALDRERPSLGPALPSGPELELPRLGQFPVPRAAIAGPRWPCPAAGHVAVAYLQVCDSAWGLRREECHIFQTIDMFVGPTALDRERPSLGPALPSGPELELPRLGQFPVPRAAIAGPRWPCPAAGHVAVAYLQVCDSAWGLRREECHIFQTIDMFVGPTALDRERPSLGPALPSGPELELPRLGQFPVPRAAIAGPRWPCPAAGHVAVAYFQVCDSAWGLRREECHIFQTIDMFVGPTALDRERPSLGPALPSGPELELPRLGQFPVPRAAIAGPRWPCPAAGHVAVAYFQVCDSAWGLRREECHIFQTIDMFVGPTALDRERPSLGPALPSGPELELPRLGQFPVPRAAIAGPRWPCPAAGHVAVAYFQVCDSAWGLRREECHIFQTIDMFVGPTALDRERPSLGPALPSGPELELPRLGQFPVPRAAIAGPRWPCPAAGHVAVAYLQVCDSAWGLRREECHIFQTIDMFVGPTALDRERPSLGPALPSGPELELPRLGQFPVPRAAIAGPRWPCPAAGHVAVAYLQVCDSAWGLRREECHIFQTIDMFVYQMYEEKVAGYLGPNKPKVCLKLPKPEQPEFLLSPVACPYPSLTMPSLVDCTCRTAGSDWGRVQVPHFCLFVSASGTLKACPQKHLNGILGCHLSKVPVSHAELWVRLQGYTCLQVPVDPQLASGSNEARHSDSSSTCSFAENIDSRNQLLLHKVPVTDGYLASNPKQDNTIEGSATNSHASQVTAHPVGSDVLRKEMIQRKCHFSKWRLSYRIPGFPLEVQRYQELLELQGPALATMKGCK
ncbi:uncharacterized protein [Oryctolagus cuniculus]|uniref:uncharacterized protein isoform X4 n=2 Tax=Oryctolagus cuniculus TaxID=9986 RepID=UPI003879A919